METPNPRRIALLFLSACSATVSTPARASEAVTLQATTPAFRLEAETGYSASGAFGGFGLGVRGGWSPIRYMLMGPGVESAMLGAQGMALTGSFSQKFRTTFVAAFVRGQLPLAMVTPYAELALGYVVIHDREESNSSCRYTSGAGASVALGADVRLIHSLTLGARAGLRNPGFGQACTAQLGPWSFDRQSLKSIAVTVGYSW